MLDLEDLLRAASEGVQRAPLHCHIARHTSRKPQDDPALLDTNAAYLWASVWVRTFGCAHNISDSEYMAGPLADYGFRYADQCLTLFFENDGC